MRTRRTTYDAAACKSVPHSRSSKLPARSTDASLTKRRRKCEDKEAAAPAGWSWSQSQQSGQSKWPAAWFDSYCKSEQMRDYMNQEWGFEKRGDQPLFEKLCLEGAQAGLSWSTILAKRKAYRTAFHNFDIQKCARMSSSDEERLLLPAAPSVPKHAQIVRNKAKVASVPQNARSLLALMAEASKLTSETPAHGHFDAFLWSFVGGRPTFSDRAPEEKCPAVTPTSEAMSKALKARGFRFVGPTICYSFMQACGLVIDHPKGSPQWVAARERLGVSNTI